MFVKSLRSFLRFGRVGRSVPGPVPTRPRRVVPLVEELETRLTPAGVLTYTDIDGDTVTIASSKGNVNHLTAAAVFSPPTGLGRQLFRLDLSDPVFVDTHLTVSASRADATGDGIKEGDGLVNVGRIDASGLDLGSVTIEGDLGGIICGDGDAATGAGLGLLSVRSMGLYGTATQGGSGSLGSVVEGALGALRVGGDIKGASIGARNTSDRADGRIGSVLVGGSLIGTALGGSLTSTGDMASVTIGGDVVGGPTGSSGNISCGGRLVSLTIGGSLLGGGGFISGRISADKIVSATIGGDIRGGTDTATGQVISAGKIGSLTVGGSLVGGSGDQPFLRNSTLVSGQIIALGDVGTLRIAGDVVGRGGLASGTIQGFANIAEVIIGGSLIGGGGDDSGKIDCFGKITRLAIGGSILGGSGNQHVTADDNGIVHEGQVFAVGDIDRVRVRGDVIGGAGIATGEVRSVAKLSSVVIGGSLIGSTGQAGGQLASGGDMGPVRIGGDVIGGQSPFTGLIISAGRLTGLHIGGSLVGGTANSTGQVLATGNILAVTIGGDLQGGSITGSEPSLDSSGYIQGDRIGRVFIGGSIITGLDNSTGGELIRNGSIRVNDDIGAITVRGSLVGNETANGVSRVIISARGRETVPPGEADVAIGSLTVGRRVELANVLAGFDPDAPPFLGSNGNASIGAVSVGGNWIASNLSAGVQDGGLPGFGTAGDTVIDNPPGAPADALVARIERIFIRGLVIGTASVNIVHFGFSAQRIRFFHSRGFTAPMTAGVDVYELSPITGDVTLREV